MYKLMLNYDLITIQRLLENINVESGELYITTKLTDFNPKILQISAIYRLIDNGGVIPLTETEFSDVYFYSKNPRIDGLENLGYEITGRYSLLKNHVKNIRLYGPNKKEIAPNGRIILCSDLNLDLKFNDDLKLKSFSQFQEWSNLDESSLDAISQGIKRTLG